MNDYQYRLDTSPRKSLCPGCGKKRFVKYIDTATGEYLPERYGRCDRESNCSYHLNPYKKGYSKTIKERGNDSNWKPAPKPPQPPQPPPAPTVYIPGEVLRQTLTGYDKNTFLQNLLSRVAYPFPANDIEKVVSMYYLGTIKEGFRAGATTFPFIDTGGNIRAMQVKEFDETNHTTGTGFYHSMIEYHHKQNNEPLPGWLEAYGNNEKKVSCLFGEHLLKQYPTNPIALVEAPKTAIYGTLYFGFPDVPDSLLWIAVYNLSSLSFEKVEALQGRRVVLFPDLSKTGKAFDLWNRKAMEFNKRLPGTRFVVSDLLERNATEAEKESGLDLADYLIKLDFRLFRSVAPVEAKQIPVYEKHEKHEASKNNFKKTPSQEPPPEHWPVNELEKYFNEITIPDKPIKLTAWETITNPRLFIENQLIETKAHNGQRYFRAGYGRLVKLKSILS
jgi:hypothetical protein